MNEITAKDAYMIAMNYLNTMSTDLKPVFDKIREKLLMDLLICISAKEWISNYIIPFAL